MLQGRDLRDIQYHAVILPDSEKREKNQGRYKVHIPELEPLIKDSDGIYVKNQAHKWRYTPSAHYFYGEYRPYQPGTLVLIGFYEDDLNSGYIVRTISDQIKNSMPQLGVDGTPKPTTSRDDIHMIFKTPRYHNAFMVFEDASELLPNSIHLYYNMQRTTYIINTDGIHVFTMDNRGTTIMQDDNVWVMGTRRLWACSEQHNMTNLDHYVGTGMNFHRVTGVEYRSFSKALMSFQSTDRIAADAPTIWLNSMVSMTALGGEVNKGEDTNEKQKKIVQKTFPQPKVDRPDLEFKK